MLLPFVSIKETRLPIAGLQHPIRVRARLVQRSARLARARRSPINTHFRMPRAILRRMQHLPLLNATIELHKCTEMRIGNLRQRFAFLQRLVTSVEVGAAAWRRLRAVTPRARRTRFVLSGIRYRLLMRTFAYFPMRSRIELLHRSQTAFGLHANVALQVARAVGANLRLPHTKYSTLGLK